MKLAILGTSGFAHEVAWLVEDIRRDDLLHREPRFSEVVLLDRDHEDQLKDCGAVTIGIGEPAKRVLLAESIAKRFPHLAFPALVHPSFRAQTESLVISEGVIICAGVIATVNVHIARFAMVNLACTVGHSATIGECSVVNPSVNISGGVNIGRGCLIGTGAQILQNLHIGDGASVGAGAVVTKDVPPGKVAKGIPAKW